MRLIDWLPLRGRWLRYFGLGCLVLLVVGVLIRSMPPAQVICELPVPTPRPAPTLRP